MTRGAAHAGPDVARFSTATACRRAPSRSGGFIFKLAGSQRPRREAEALSVEVIIVSLGRGCREVV